MSLEEARCRELIPHFVRTRTPRLTPLNEVEMQEFIRGNFWKYAKTMPRNPHWYVLKWTARCPLEWCRAVLTIWKDGDTRMFFNKPYICLNVTADAGTVYKYWSMGKGGADVPMSATFIINRSVV